MSVYLSYWKPARVNWANPGATLLNHAASQQYHKLKSGDRVYLLTARNDEMYLLGAITVDAIVNQIEAAARLGRKPEDLWQSDYHIIARNGTAKPLQLIRCEDVLRQIEFITGNTAEAIKEPITAQRFQSMRQITPASAVILDDVLAMFDRLISP
jgi:hypothetical protein